MIEWVSQNWLALYGSIVGTIALFINVFRFRHLVKMDKVQLAISVEDQPQRTENIENLQNSNSKDPWERENFVKAYTVTIRNTGTVVAYIEDAGVICNKGNSHAVLINHSKDNCILNSIPQVRTIKVEPKSLEKLFVYYKRDEDFFIAKSVYVIDSTGKEWQKSV